MVGVAELLQQGRAAGLTVRSDGTQLVVRGPRGAGVLARQLLGRTGSPRDGREIARRKQGMSQVIS